jgi:hypothetical protein
MPSPVNDNATPKHYVATRVLCSECVKKHEEIKRLREENKNLKDEIRRLKNKIEEGYFGASTPSSKKPFKPNPAPSTQPQSNGGAKPGHRGAGRTAVALAEAEVIKTIDTEVTHCPNCEVFLDSRGVRHRTVWEIVPLKIQTVLYKLRRRRCPECHDFFQARVPDTLPKFMLNNELLTHVAIEHYLEGIPINRLSARLDLHRGTLLHDMNYLAELFHAVPERLIESYRQALVKHADEIPQSGAL